MNNFVQIGGPEHVAETDKSLSSGRKYNRGQSYRSSGFSTKAKFKSVFGPKNCNMMRFKEHSHFHFWTQVS